MMNSAPRAEIASPEVVNSTPRTQTAQRPQARAPNSFAGDEPKHAPKRCQVGAMEFDAYFVWDSSINISKERPEVEMTIEPSLPFEEPSLFGRAIDECLREDFVDSVVELQNPRSKKSLSNRRRLIPLRRARMSGLPWASPDDAFASPELPRDEVPTLALDQ